MLSALGLARDPARVGACNRETTPRDGVDVFSVNAPHSVRDGFVFRLESQSACEGRPREIEERCVFDALSAWVGA